MNTHAFSKQQRADENQRNDQSTGQSAGEPPSRPDDTPRPQRGQSASLGIIAFAAGFWLLRETAAIALPTAFALLLTLGVWPLVRWVRGYLPQSFKWVGAIVGGAAIIAVLLSFVAGLTFASSELYAISSELAPVLQDRLTNLSVPAFLKDRIGGDTSYLPSSDAVLTSALSALSTTASSLATIVLIVFLALLMLSGAENWRGTIRSISPARVTSPAEANSSDVGQSRWSTIIHLAGQKFRAYFLTRFLVGTLTAALYAVWLGIFGIEHLLLWAVLTIILNFIPTIGSIISGTLPALYVLLTRDLTTAAIIAAGIVVIEQTMGNFVDPRLMGKRLAISPLIVLISLVFWSLLWGMPGAFLAVPMTVLASIVMAHYDMSKPVALMLTNCSSYEDLKDYREPD